MTPSEAVALAVIGHSHRRLLAALLRVIGGRATAEDIEGLPSREPGESVIAWACRSRAAPANPAEWLNECRRVQALAAQQLSTAARRGLVASHTRGRVAIRRFSPRFPIRRPFCGSADGLDCARRG